VKCCIYTLLHFILSVISYKNVDVLKKKQSLLTNLFVTKKQHYFYFLLLCINFIKKNFLLATLLFLLWILLTKKQCDFNLFPDMCMILNDACVELVNTKSSSKGGCSYFAADEGSFHFELCSFCAEKKIHTLYILCQLC